MLTLPFASSARLHPGHLAWYSINHFFSLPLLTLFTFAVAQNQNLLAGNVFVGMIRVSSISVQHLHLQETSSCCSATQCGSSHLILHLLEFSHSLWSCCNKAPWQVRILPWPSHHSRIPGAASHGPTYSWEHPSFDWCDHQFLNHFSVVQVLWFPTEWEQEHWLAIVKLAHMFGSTTQSSKLTGGMWHNLQFSQQHRVECNGAYWHDCTSVTNDFCTLYWLSDMMYPALKKVFYDIVFNELLFGSSKLSLLSMLCVVVCFGYPLIR